MQIDKALCHSSPVEHLQCAVQNTQIHISQTALHLFVSVYLTFPPLWMNAERPSSLIQTRHSRDQISLCP